MDDSNTLKMKILKDIKEEINKSMKTSALKEAKFWNRK